MAGRAYLWMMMRDANIYRRGECGYIFVYKSSCFAHFIVKESEIKWNIKEEFGTNTSEANALLLPSL